MIESVLGKSVAANLSTGGTVDGDLTITGNLGVAGDASVNLTSVVSNSTIIDATGTEAFLVRKESDAGDVFVVDTTNNKATLGDAAGDSSLTIKASNSTNSILYFGDAGNATIAGIDYDHNDNSMDFNTANSTRMTITSAGSVGIGTASPEGALDIQNGNIALITGADVNDTSLTNDTRKFARFGMHHYHNAEEQVSLIIGDSDGTDNIVAIGGMSGTTNSATQLRFYTAANDATVTGTERMRIDSSGNVGIGVTAPSAKIDIADSGMLALLGSSSGTTRADATSKVARVGVVHYTNAQEPVGFLYGQSTASKNQIGIGGGSATFNAATEINFWTAANQTTTTGTNRMHIDSSGNVGIGTTPTYDLDVSKAVSGGQVTLRVANSSTDANSSAKLYLGAFGASGTGDPYIYFNDDVNDWALGIDKSDSSKFKISDSSSVGANDRLVIDTSGNIGIGTSSPDGLLNTSKASASHAVNLDTFSTTAGHGTSLNIRHSNHASNVAETADTTVLGTLNFKGVDSGGNFDTGAGIQAIQDGSAGTKVPSKMYFFVSDNDSTNTIMTMDSSNVGIGTESPTDLMDLRTDPTNTSQPGAATTGADPHNAIRISSTGNAVNEKIGIAFGGYSGYLHGGIYGVGDSVSNNTSGDITFDLRVSDTDTTFTEVMRITHEGNVDIGGQKGAIATDTYLTISGGEGNNAIIQMNADNGDDNADKHQLLAVNGAFAYREFSTGGWLNRLLLDANSRISLSNNDSGVSNTIFGKTAGDSDGAGDYNVFVGELSGGTGTQTDDADYNVGIGYSALTDLTTGESNVAIGGHALENNTSGEANIAIGSWDSSTYQAPLTTNTVGSFNIAIGSGVLRLANENDNDGSVGIGYGALNNQAGTGGLQYANATTAVGHKALTALTTGGSNTAVGYLALTGHTTGGANVALGYGALKGTSGATASTSSNNIAIGANALGGDWNDSAASNYNIAIGGDSQDGVLNGAVGNVSMGYQSMGSLTSGLANTAVGHSAGTTFSTQSQNTVIGYQAAQSSQAGNITALGYKALEDCTADGTVGIGHSAGMNITSGARNLAVGYQALYQSDVCSDSIAIGYLALSGTDAGTNNKNIAIGNYALDANMTHNTNNIAIGYNSLTNLAGSGGIYNTFVGDDSGVSLTNADYNTGVGSGVFGEASGNAMTGVGNTGVGSLAGYNLEGVAHSNTLIGYGAGNASNAITTGISNVCIGDGASTSSATADNQISIGTGAVGQVDNSVTLGNSSVTAVYMSSDSGAVVHAAGMKFDNDQTNNIDEANTLDDYEEGYYTATLTCGSGTVTIKSTHNELAYTKIGRVVWIQGGLVVDSVSSPAGTLLLNLPFTATDLTKIAGASTGVASYYYANALKSASPIGVNVRDGNATASLMEWTTTNEDGTDMAENIQATTQLYFSLSFIVA